MRGSINFRRGGGGDVQVHLTYKKTLTRFSSSRLILQKSNGYFLRQLSFSEVPGGLGDCLFPIETHITCDFP